MVDIGSEKEKICEKCFKSFEGKGNVCENCLMIEDIYKQIENSKPVFRICRR